MTRPALALARKRPVHVTVRMDAGVWNLRTRRCFTGLAKALWAGAERFGLRLVHYSAQGNHLHLLVEADDGQALSRGMKGLNVRIARALTGCPRPRQIHSQPFPHQAKPSWPAA